MDFIYLYRYMGYPTSTLWIDCFSNLQLPKQEQLGTCKALIIQLFFTNHTETPRNNKHEASFFFFRRLFELRAH